MIEKNASQVGMPVRAPVPTGKNPLHSILVVDDDIYIRQLSAESLALCGYHVDAAEDGAAAWQALNTDTYDLLVTDNDMPKVSGIELVRKLHAAHMALPVIMVSGSLPTDEFARNPWLMPAATLLKPYTIAALVETVDKVLRANDRASEVFVPSRNGPPIHALAHRGNPQ